MRFYTYIGEDHESAREYRKAVFDLKVAIGEFDYEDTEPVADDPEIRRRRKERMISLKEKIVMLKEKIVKLSVGVGEGIDPELQKVLDTIPDRPKEDGESEEDKE